MPQSRSPDAVWHQSTVTRSRRQQLNGHRSAIIWFTGLSGSGKSTLAHAVEEVLYQRGHRTFVFDGDNVRHGLCGDLGFSDSDRTENIRRIGQMAKLFIESEVIALTAFISPFRIDRQRVRMMVDHDQDFIEIYCQFMILLGPIAISAQYCWVIAYKLADVSLVTPINYTWIVFSALLGYFLFEEELGIPVIIGSACIVLGGIILSRLPDPEKL